MNSKKVLIVDDDETIRDALNDAFSGAGYKVLMAESGEDAIDILKKERILVMFLDLQLPGMSGIELCKKIRKDNSVAIIYAITAHFDLFNVIEWRAAGFDDFFSKPFLIKDLLGAAQEAFEKIDRWMFI